MKLAHILTVAVSLTVGSVFAQDFDNLQLLNTVSHTAQPAASGQGAPGPAAPYYGGSGYYPNQYQDPYQQNLEWRYSSVKQGLKHYASYYGWFSREREYYNAQARQGEDLWVRYLRYRDAYSAAALSQWISYWESTMYRGNSWNNGGYYGGNGGYYGGNGGYYGGNGGYYGGNGGYYGGNGGYYGNGGYDDYYRRRGSWGYQPYYANENFSHGLQIGDGIGHIVNGSRSGNDLGTVGGILSTAGGVINVINSARR